jgi:hypothetical protein
MKEAICVEKEPKKLITKIFEFCALFALSVFLIRLGILYLSDIWWILALLAALAGVGIVCYRIWKHKNRW